MIPKIIHQFWVGEKSPPMVWINEWKKKNPKFKHILWDEKRMKQFPLVNQDKYDQYYKEKCFNGCSDIARYEILKKYGGIYIDADSVCVKTIEKAPFLKYDIFFTYEGENYWYINEDYIDSEDGYVEGAVRSVLTSPVGCIPNHPIIDDIIDNLTKQTELHPCFLKVANCLISNILKKYPDINILPAYSFTPVHHDGTIAEKDGENYSTHIFGTTLNNYNSMAFERITEDPFFDSEREEHEYRYKLANKYINNNDVVLDVACGIGYSKEILGGKYIGVDRELLCDNIVADLNEWQPDFDFDIGISFETIEHLENYQNLVEILKKAKKYIIYSAPVIPTKGGNPYHLQDFTYEQLKHLFGDWGQIIHEETQPNPYTGEPLYGIFVVKKTNPKAKYAAQTLYEAKTILDKLEIPFTLFLGTTLGAYRDGEFCPGDEDDIDLAIDVKYFDRKDEIAQAFIDAGWIKHCYWIPSDNIAPEMAHIKNIEGYNIKVDLFFISELGGKKVFRLYSNEDPNGEQRTTLFIDSKYFKTTDKIKFYGTEYNIPTPTEQYLEDTYGRDWKTPMDRNEWQRLGLPHTLTKTKDI